MNKLYPINIVAQQSLFIICFVFFFLMPIDASAAACAALDKDSLIFSNVKKKLNNGHIEYHITVKNNLKAPLALKLDFSLKNMKIIAGDSRINLKPLEKKNIIKLKTVKPNKSASFDFKSKWQFGKFNAKHSRYSYRLPYAKDEAYPVSQAYEGGKTHKGDMRFAIDWAMDVGTPIHAAREGTVIYSCEKYSEGKFHASLKDKANIITIYHKDGTVAVYAHLKKNGIKVSVGQRVRKGQLIGYSGNTGYSGGPHLHFHVTYLTNDLKTKTIPTRFITSQGNIELKLNDNFKAF